MQVQPLIANEIAEALSDQSGVVALESTLITHGLPWPDNFEVACAAEAAVRDGGAIPATVAVLGGVIRVGLSLVEIEHMARSNQFQKASRRDLSFCVAQGFDAATTVAATLWVARRVGIGIMATGGLGGVHRGASTTFDISADLDELARSDGSALVCSGVKSILDIPATLEILESWGVPVVGYRTNSFPAFTSITSGLPLDARVDTPAGAARIIQAHRELLLPCAVVLAQPVSAEAALDHELMNTALTHALLAAEVAGIKGKATTPFLLDQIRIATGGRSLIANKALIIANAALAGQIAAELAQIP